MPPAPAVAACPRRPARLAPGQQADTAGRIPSAGGSALATHRRDVQPPCRTGQPLLFSLKNIKPRSWNKSGGTAPLSQAPRPAPSCSPAPRTSAAVHGAVEQQDAAQRGRLQHHQPRQQPPPHGRHQRPPRSSPVGRPRNGGRARPPHGEGRRREGGWAVPTRAKPRWAVPSRSDPCLDKTRHARL